MSKGGPKLSKKLSVECDGIDVLSCDDAMWSPVAKSVAFSSPVAKCDSGETFRCVRSVRRSEPKKPRRAKASAARVSRGSQADTWQGLSVKAPKRDAQQHVTVTVVIYNTVAGGVPSPEDVAAAIADMDALYASCGWTGALASEGANFMKSELTVGDALKIAAKVTTQPYKPDSLAPQDADVFPTSITV